MENEKYIVVALRDDNTFDCILEQQIFDTKEGAQESIFSAKIEDRMSGWDYIYKICAVYNQ